MELEAQGRSMISAIKARMLQQSADERTLCQMHARNGIIRARMVVLHAQVVCRLCTRNDRLGKIRVLFSRILVKSKHRHEEVSSLLEIA